MKPAGNQLLAEFTHCRSTLLLDTSELVSVLERAISAAGLHIVETSCKHFEPHGATILALISESHVVLHTYPEADHLSVDIFTCAGDLGPAHQVLRNLQKELAPGSIRTAEVKRGAMLDVSRPGWVQLTSTDGIDVRLQIAECLHSAQSEFQKIEVVRSEQFGTMLVIDDHLQLASADAGLYNTCLIQPLCQLGASFENVLLLGAGDGALATQVLQEEPTEIQVVDIDPVVGQICREFFPDLVQSAFDDTRCQFHYIDALSFLVQRAFERHYDTAIYDLTMHPEAFTKKTRREYLGELFSVLEQSMKPGALLSLQCCSSHDVETRRMIEELLLVCFEQHSFHEAFIPSLCRPWLFATAGVAR